MTNQPADNFSDDLSRRVFAYLPLGICYHVDGEILFANEHLRSMVGVSQDADITGIRVQDWVPAELQPAIQERLRILYERREEAPWQDVIIQDTGGKRLNVRLMSIPMDFDGRQGGLTVLEDQSLLKRTRSSLDRLFEHSPVALWLEDFSAVHARVELWRREGITDFRTFFRDNPGAARDCAGLVRVLDVNQATLRMHRAASREQLINSLPRILTEKSILVFQEELVGIIEAGVPFDATTEVMTLDGQSRTVIVRFFLDPEAPDWSVVYVAITDITDRLLDQEENARLASAVHAAAEVVVISGLDRKILYVNPAFEELTGYSSAEVMGRSPEFLNSGAQEPAYIEEIWTTVLAGRVWQGSFNNLAKDKTVFETESTISPVFDDAGNVVSVVDVQRNVTRERNLERQLILSQRLEAVGQLAGGLAHDFNNILQTMMGAVEFVLDPEASPDDKARDMHTIKSGIENAAGLTHQLLAFSRQQILEMVNLDPNALVEKLLIMIRRVMYENVELRYEPGFKTGLVKADPGQLEQVLLNLCINARDAMPEGGTLTLSTGRQYLDDEYVQDHPWARQGDFVSFQVTDTGAGMDAETLAQVFEPFFTTKVGGKGTGLGLATVYGIVKQHEGIIQADSSPGRGTTFRVYLPLAEGVELDLPASEPPAPAVGGSETILVAEDDPMVLEVLRRVLDRSGYHVLTAQDGEEALKIFHRDKDAVDLFMLDMIMPGLGGAEVHDRIREERPRARILFSSGYSKDALHTRFVLKDGINLIRKPHDPRQLLHRIRQILDAD